MMMKERKRERKGMNIFADAIELEEAQVYCAIFKTVNNGVFWHVRLCGSYKSHTA
jgi:hypothetical protein